MNPDPAAKRLRTLTTLGLVVAALGFADAAYLTWDHFAHLASPDYGGGLCGVGEGCDIARTSPLSEVPLPFGLPGLPIALGGAAFYAAIAGLLFALRAPASGGSPPPSAAAGGAGATVGLMVLLSGLAVAYSAFLAAMSLQAGGLCPFCTGLYALNLALFLLSAFPLGRAVGGLRSPLRASGRVLPAALVGSVVLGGGYGVYAVALSLRDPGRPSPLLGEASHAMPVDGRPSVGPVAAPLQIVEFADFECPHCGGAFRKLRELGAAFPSEIRVTFLHFPLDTACNPLVTAPFHIRACHLASLAECAHRQGRFADAAALLYERARGRSDADLRADLVTLGLDAGALDACLADPAAAAAVRADVDLGLRVGVEGTPTLYVNGRKLGRPLTEAVVRELLARGSGSGAPPADATPPAAR